MVGLDALEGLGVRLLDKLGRRPVHKACERERERWISGCRCGSVRSRSTGARGRTLAEVERVLGDVAGERREDGPHAAGRGGGGGQLDESCRSALVAPLVDRPLLSSDMHRLHMPVELRAERRSGEGKSENEGDALSLGDLARDLVRDVPAKGLGLVSVAVGGRLGGRAGHGAACEVVEASRRGGARGRGEEGGESRCAR